MKPEFSATTDTIGESTGIQHKPVGLSRTMKLRPAVLKEEVYYVYYLK
jgi:hypothetical protein